MQWNTDENEQNPKPKLRHWPLMGLRILLMVVGNIIIMSLYVLFYGIERIFPRLHVTAIIANIWGRFGLFVFGVKFELVGEHMEHGGAIVANHISWMDIFTFHAAAKISYVSKAEVRNWPVIGQMARITNTLFIERKPTEAKRHQEALLKRLDAGDQLCFFPEGTSTDGLRVLDFKSTLFAVFHTPELIEHVWVQPATATYFPPKGQPAHFYGWWGDMSFGEHVLSILAYSRGGKVRVTLHDPVKASDFASRKELARYSQDVVRAGFAKDLGVEISEVSQ